jgi:hypothetical protein
LASCVHTLRTWLYLVRHVPVYVPYTLTASSVCEMKSDCGRRSPECEQDLPVPRDLGSVVSRVSRQPTRVSSFAHRPPRMRVYVRTVCPNHQKHRNATNLNSRVRVASYPKTRTNNSVV